MNSLTMSLYARLSSIKLIKVWIIVFYGSECLSAVLAESVSVLMALLQFVVSLLYIHHLPLVDTLVVGCVTTTPP